MEVVGAQGLAVLRVCLLGDETMKDGEEVGRVRAVVLADDGVHDGFDSDLDGLAGLAAGIVDVAVVDVGGAQVGQIDKRHATAGEAEEEQVAGKLQLLQVPAEPLVVGRFAQTDKSVGNGEMEEALDVLGLDGTFARLGHSGIGQCERVARGQTQTDCPIENGMQAAQVTRRCVAADALTP